VLSSDQLRAAYDREGTEAATDVNFVDPAFFFNMLFGSEKFEPYVGKLKLAQVASAVGEPNERGLGFKDGLMSLPLAYRYALWVGEVRALRGQAQTRQVASAVGEPYQL
jgi:hypothetical protein